MRYFITFLYLFMCSFEYAQAENKPIKFEGSINYYTQKYLGHKFNKNSTGSGNISFGMQNKIGGLSSSLYVNKDKNNINFDRSFFEYNIGIAKIGIGKIDRHWSFSKNTSLIMSSNARPIDSIYLHLDSVIKNKNIPHDIKWSFDVFNGITNNSLNNGNSLILGARATINPIKNLDIELLQTSQFGGKGYGEGPGEFFAAAFKGSNEGKFTNINKMAGFGISYKIKQNIFPLRVYTQIIGEDEAGNLPSCLMYLAGAEWNKSNGKLQSTFGLELINTKITPSTSGNCNSNTAYNNSIYNYTNYGVVMGTEIDTESNSLELFGVTSINSNLSIDYSLKQTSINQRDWPQHRLSNSKQSGYISSIGFSWRKGPLELVGNVYNQTFVLEKLDAKDGIGLNFSTSIKF